MPDLLPALASLNLPEKPSDLDGWSARDVLRWVGPIVPLFPHIQRVDDARLSVGLALWKLREVLGEGEYGPEVDRLAAEAGVHPSTLGRWRSDAETHWRIDPPSKSAKRSEAQRARRAAEKARRAAEKEAELIAKRDKLAAIEVTGKPVPNADLLVGLDPVPVASGASTVPDPAPGGNGAAAQSGGPPAELDEGAASTPQEPSAPTEGFTDDDAPDEEELRRRHEDALARSRLSGGILTDDDAPQEPKPKREPPSPGELVAALLRFKPDRLASIDGPSLRSLLALVRGALEAQAAKAKPAAAGGVTCPHPKNKRKSFGYITICEVCGQKV